MTHEFDFRVEVRTIDQSIGTIDREGGDICFAQVAIADTRLFPNGRAGNEHRRRATERLAACWNALAGLNPDAVADVVAALEPFALIADEGLVRKGQVYATVTTCAEYFERARTALARIRGEG